MRPAAGRRKFLAMLEERVNWKETEKARQDWREGDRRPEVAQGTARKAAHANGPLQMISRGMGLCLGTICAPPPRNSGSPVSFCPHGRDGRAPLAKA